MSKIVDTIPVYEEYVSIVEDAPPFEAMGCHATFDAAFKSLVRRSCHFAKKPWGGFSEGAVFEHFRFKIELSRFVKVDGKKVRLSSECLFSYRKWDDRSLDTRSMVDIHGVAEKFREASRRRWRWCWDHVEDRNGVPRKDRSDS